MVTDDLDIYMCTTENRIEKNAITEDEFEASDKPWNQWNEEYIIFCIQTCALLCIVTTWKRKYTKGSGKDIFGDSDGSAAWT